MGTFQVLLTVSLLALAWSAQCGNGVHEDAEECDDRNRLNGDGCSTSCTVERGFTCIPRWIADSGGRGTLTYYKNNEYIQTKVTCPRGWQSMLTLTECNTEAV